MAGGEKEPGKIGLIHVSDMDPGFSRKRFGKGFAFYDDKGEKITDPRVLERIRKIVIPPNWKDVWICTLPQGYLQATGFDARRRKQYLYHEEWVVHQQEFKYRKLREFAYALPKIRNTVEMFLRKKGWPREKVLALIVGILDKTYVRIGNKQYYNLHGTHGLTTLRRKNLYINGKEIVFRYVAKSRKLIRVKIEDRKFVRLIRECSELQGYEVFRYKDESGKTLPVDSNDVNLFIQEIAGDEFTSKNFRTWGGTVLAIEKYPEALRKTHQNKNLKLRKAIIREVAAELHNTLSVCERYYIHPAVLETLENPEFSPVNYSLDRYPEELSEAERIALAIIEKNMRT